ncbi:hypothetical protein [Ktedonobacter racemifer]|uniref:hypothetical protein n=1 Tax=Ktedonobacter racemifer TaxID=363277 RepID=UPI0012F934A2|nr:hypothetical protein [Ktedonobacter racemifer]
MKKVLLASRVHGKRASTVLWGTVGKGSYVVVSATDKAPRWRSTLPIIPDASGREAKAARLRRYAEVRWSPEVTTTLQSETGGH